MDKNNNNETSGKQTSRRHERWELVGLFACSIENQIGFKWQTFACRFASTIGITIKNFGEREREIGCTQINSSWTTIET